MDPTLEKTAARARSGSYLGCYGEIASLALGASSHLEYFSGALKCIDSTCRSIYSQIQVGLPSETIRHSIRDPGHDPSFWSGAAGEFLAEAMREGMAISRVFRKRGGTEEIAVLAAPIPGTEDHPLGAVVIFSPCERGEIARWMATLSSLCEFAGQCISLCAGASPAPGGGKDAGAFQAIEKAAGLDSPDELAFLMVNGLKARTGSEQAFLGRARRRGVEVLAISGVERVHPRSSSVSGIVQAMAESLDLRRSTSCPAGSGEEPGHDPRLLRKWHASAGGDPVACVPILDARGNGLILALRRKGGRPFASKELEAAADVVRPYLPAFELLEMARRSIARHLLDSLAGGARGLLAPRGWKAKVAAAALLAGCVWFFLGTLPYRPAAPFVLVPQEVHHLSAPASAVLREASGLAGMRVEEGHVLCRFDDREARIEKARLAAELEAAVLERNRALQKEDRGAALLAEVEERRLRALLENIELRIERHAVRAPFAGTIMSGDLRCRIGDRFAPGEPLYQILRDGSWLAALEVPEDRISGIQVGQEGSFRLFARPEEGHRLEVLRIAPASSRREGRNVYLVETRTDLRDGWLRAGMEGTARIEVGPRPVW